MLQENLCHFYLMHCGVGSFFGFSARRMSAEECHAGEKYNYAALFRKILPNSYNTCMNYSRIYITVQHFVCVFLPFLCENSMQDLQVKCMNYSRMTVQPFAEKDPPSHQQGTALQHY